MKLDHVNLTVTDVSAAAHFLERYFEEREVERHECTSKSIVHDPGEAFDEPEVTG